MRFSKNIWALGIITLSYLLLVVDLSIAIAALPSIKIDLGFSTTSLSWIQNAYTLVFGGLLLVGAKLGDIFGRRRIFILGVALFSLASMLVGFSVSQEMMIIVRGLQGVGAALVAPSSLALLSTTFPEQPGRGRALAIYGSITGLGTSIGLVLGGMITGLADWRWAFWGNFPLGVLLVLTATKFIPKSEKHADRIDIWGAVLSTIGMTSLVYGFIESAEVGWANPSSWLSFIFGVLFILIFIWFENRFSNPLVPLRLFKNATRSGANLARALFVGSMAGFWFFGSQYLQIAKGMSPVETGFAFLPMTLASFAIAFFVPRLSRKFGDNLFLVGGLSTVAIGTLWLSQVSVSGSYLLTIAVPMILVGIGQGASTIKLTSAGIHAVSKEDSGVASGLVSTSVQIGSSVGLSLLVALASFAPTENSDAKTQITSQANYALFGGGILCLLALASVLIWVLPRRQKA